MTDTALTPSRLWKTMTLDQRQRAARAFWSDEEAADDQRQAALLIAQQKKFRPKTVVALDLDRKARHLASLAMLPDPLAARALIVYHLTDQRAMMGTFLDALEIKHDNGLIDEESVKPDAAKLPPAVSKIKADFPLDDVHLYLKTLLCQDPETWGGLKPLVSD
ncbi:MAG TPA: hypothetical protein VF219_11885 [Vicinamibacterales bacterium]